jgi:NhaC family Na+:H+ antiporter
MTDQNGGADFQPPASGPAAPGVATMQSSPRPPSLLDALAPVIVLITLLVLTLVLYGVDAANGPLQVALLVSASFAALVAYKNGYTFAVLSDAAIGGVSSAMGAIFILLAVGGLIGTWNLCGTIPTIVSYGLALLRPAIFFATVAIICALVGAVTGSSWTTAGTLGVAFVGMAPVLGMSQTITAGAVISGAYMGDKMSPLSETTVLVPQLVGGVTTNQHIRGMLVTVIPSFGAAFLIFLGIGLANNTVGTTIDTSAARNAIAAVYNITPLNLLPLVLLIVLSIRRAPAFLAILATALFSGVLASFTQPDVVKALVGKPHQGPVLNGIEAIFTSMASGHVAHSSNATINDLFSRGGMASMLTTVWLILGALSFAAIMEHAGFLNRLMRPLVHRAKTDGQLIAAVGVSAIGLNVIAGDQYVADVLPSRAFRTEFERRGLAPRMLSRTVEDTGTVTSVLVPWNSCGAYMTGVLGVPTVEYLPYAFFNFINPILAIVFGFLGFKVEHQPPPTESSTQPPSDTAKPEQRAPAGEQVVQPEPAQKSVEQSASSP